MGKVACITSRPDVIRRWLYLVGGIASADEFAEHSSGPDKICAYD